MTPTFALTTSKMTGSGPKDSTVALPGLVGTALGKGAMTMEPVSACLGNKGRDKYGKKDKGREK